MKTKPPPLRPPPEVGRDPARVSLYHPFLRCVRDDGTIVVANSDTGNVVVYEADDLRELMQGNYPGRPFG